MDDFELTSIREALITEYQYIRRELELRVRYQVNSLYWAIPLTGSFLAALVALETKDGTSILSALLTGNAEDSIPVCLTLILTYALIIELLMSFEVYQLFQVFHLHRMTADIEHRYKEYLRLPSAMRFFQIDEIEGLTNKRLEDIPMFPWSLAKYLRMITRIQTLTFFALSAMSLGYASILLFNYWNEAPLQRSNLNWIFSSFVLLLGIGLILVLKSKRALHEWLSVRLANLTQPVAATFEHLK